MTPFQDYSNIAELLQQTTTEAEKYFHRQPTDAPGRFIENITLSSLHLQGVGAAAALKYFAKHYADKVTNSTGPNYFGFVTGGSTPAAVMGDWLVSTYDQNACGSNDTIAPQLERLTLHWLKELLGIDPQYFGSFVTGATMSNFVGLALGRQWIGEQAGINFSQEGLQNTVPVKVLSATPHSSILKSMSMLGLGRNAWVKIPTLPNREAIDVDALEKYLEQNSSPVIIVANAGTVNTVDFDDLERIGQLKNKYSFWLHVDAAFGGFAACSEKYKTLTNGINHADSICVDAHKWLNVPYDGAMQFTKHQSLQLRVFQNSAAYLGDAAMSPDFFHYTPENSRRWRALPAWFTLMAYGKEGYREIVERNCESAQHFGNLLQQTALFKLLAPVRMNVVCFSLKDAVSMDEIRAFLAAVRDDGRIFFTPTLYQGIPGIRAAVSNWQTSPTHMNQAITVLEEIGQAWRTKSLVSH